MKETLLKTLETSRQYTLAVAEAMPEKNYHFKPVDTIWNFGELIDHIAYGIGWWEDNFIKGRKTDWAPAAAKVKKKEVLDYLRSAYDSLAATMSKATCTEKEVDGFHATLDHITHHRGQATVYLRCQGITPPEYAR